MNKKEKIIDTKINTIKVKFKDKTTLWNIIYEWNKEYFINKEDFELIKKFII